MCYVNIQMTQAQTLLIENKSLTKRKCKKKVLTRRKENKQTQSKNSTQNGPEEEKHSP